MLRPALNHLARLSVISTFAALSGCILDPISIATNAMAEAQMSPENIGATPAAYRSYDCGMLASTRDTFAGELRKNRDDPRVWQWHINAIDQVSVEKQCSNTTASAANIAPATTPTGVLGIRMDAVSPSIAQALALSPARGALVLETLPGGGAEKAGIKPMDVILEIAGQAIQQPAELQAIVGRMRPGFNAPLQIWRKGTALDINVDIAAPTALAMTTPATTALAATDSQAMAIPVSGQKLYCVAWMLDTRPPTRLAFAPIRETAPFANGAAVVDSLNAYIAQVKTVQPGVWNDLQFSPKTCVESQCFMKDSSATGQPGQFATQSCSTSLEQAQKVVAPFLAQQRDKLVPWP